MRIKPSVEELWAGIQAGNRAKLSQAITRVESTRIEDRKDSLVLLEYAWEYFGRAKKIGITGSPGVGKSSFLEALGCYLANQGHLIAVLTIDPSSPLTHGSILGDKTRMEKLASHPLAYIRPSASGGALGGVHASSQEVMLLLEAFGFEYIFLETVGVGQSEVQVREMVDFFLLLMLANAGDELQGIKKGIMEMADAVVITKSDIDSIAAKKAKVEFQSALRYFSRFSTDWQPIVETCSSLQNIGLEKIESILNQYFKQYLTPELKHQKHQKQNIAWWKRVQQQYIQAWLQKETSILQEGESIYQHIQFEEISIPQALQQWDFLLRSLSIHHE